jgi:putative hydroxymethylpyrimidine transport system substrate-binding protein
MVAKRESLDEAGASRLRRFITATAAGHRLVRENPAAGVDALLKADKGLDRKLTEAQIRATLPTFFPKPDQPYGWMEPVDWANYERWMRKSNLLKRPPSEAPPLTNEFLPGEGLGSSARG